VRCPLCVFTKLCVYVLCVCDVCLPFFGKGAVGSTASNVLMFAGHRKRDGLEAMIYKKGYDNGWTRGSISGTIAIAVGRHSAFILLPFIQFHRCY
jgi:hypothetical protein